MSTPTEAHRKLAKQMGVTCGNEYAAQILRESEARAVEAAAQQWALASPEVQHFNALSAELRKERERVRVLEEAITDHRAFDKRAGRDAILYAALATPERKEGSHVGQ